jgi:molybdenum cofactor sulfurtransferase
VSSDPEKTISESGWKIVQHRDSDLIFETAGDCARCSMVDVDPTTGMKGKTLRALADHNRRDGRITFGIFLRQTKAPRNTDEHKISQGDILFCK